MSDTNVRIHGRQRFHFVATCFKAVLDDVRLHNRWMHVETLVTEVNLIQNLGNEVAVKKDELIRLVNKEYSNQSSVGNPLVTLGGLELRLYRHGHNKKGGGRQHFFHAASQGAIPFFPTSTSSAAWEAACASQPLPPRTRQNAQLMEQVSDSTILAPFRKRRRLSLGDAPNELTPLSDSPTSTSTQQDSTLQDSAFSYWTSGDARKLFAPKSKYGADCDVRQVVVDRIDTLEKCNKIGSFWRFLIDGQDPDNMCSEYDIFLIRQRSLYLAHALRKFVDEVKSGSRWTWQQSIEHSISAMAEIGLTTYTSWRPLQRWHRVLAYSIANTFCKAPEPKDRLPPFFRENPDAMEAFKQYGVDNLKDLSVEKMHNYVHDVLIPTMRSRLENGFANDNDDTVLDVPATTPETVLEYLQVYRLSKVSMSTIVRWMQAVGFRYKNRQKHYFVDGHERPETLAYRPVYTKRYMAHELNASRWIQVSRAASKLLEDQGFVAKSCGYNYTDEHGSEMVEYHVDASDKFPPLPMGGNLSVRKSANAPTVMFIGQDEAIFKQFLFLSKMWTGPNGERPLLPKDEGAGVMISSFISREYGLLQKLDERTLSFVNANRQGAKYADEEAAIDVNGTANKKPLTLDKSPFLVFFEYGENKEGYWDYNHMVLQFEDAVDCLKVMHPNYKYVFLFDHSSGHAKQRPDGLNAAHMNKSFGGKAPKMRSTVITKEAGFLGPFERRLQPGQEQHLVFQESDEGPFWMSPAQREASRHDSIDDNNPSEKPRNKANLISDLQAKSINCKGKNKKELIELCTIHEIPINCKETKTTEGWEGKSKGLLQVLWERGFIDNTQLSNYTIDGKKDEFGHVNLETSLRHLMGMCEDFLHEEGMMEYIGSKLGVEVMLTPKCHAEIAGEGVEYMWALAKGTYRSLALKEKKGKDNFVISVRKCLSEQVITTERIRKFSRRARQYLVAYHAIDTGQVDEATQAECSKYGPIAMEKLIGQFKTHRCAMDFDYKFVMSGD